MTQPQLHSPQATDSYIAMLRGAIALAWADGIMDAAEKDRLRELISKNTHLSFIQQDQLKSDIDTQQNLDDIWGHITDKQDRAHLINIAVNLFHEDGDYSELEKKAYHQINSLHHDTLDVAGMEAELSAMAKAAYAREEEARRADYESMSRRQRALHYLDNLFSF